ncbi:hypothetical protein FRB94_009634 [Tulasnella sp. JGI-2019a]|nr:hypothetical protein FRB94_009634 [Tulasnella sp. JGI-2019a]
MAVRRIVWNLDAHTSLIVEDFGISHYTSILMARGPLLLNDEDQKLCISALDILNLQLLPSCAVHKAPIALGKLQPFTQPNLLAHCSASIISTRLDQVDVSFPSS